MSQCECSLCGKMVNARSMKACEICFMPICPDCAKKKGAFCFECRSDHFDG